jgi:hypothetical protein
VVVVVVVTVGVGGLGDGVNGWIIVSMERVVLEVVVVVVVKVTPHYKTNH